MTFGLYSSTSQTKKGNIQMPTVPITVAYGDGIGPEIMEATLHILKEAGAKLAIEKIEIGEKVYLSGNTSGIDPSAWDSLRSTKVFLKAPITTPQGGGYKSLKCDRQEDPRIVCERSALRFLSPFRRNQTSGYGCGDRARERRGSLCGH
jgi:isocitrate dehydrogenase